MNVQNEDVPIPEDDVPAPGIEVETETKKNQKRGNEEVDVHHIRWRTRAPGAKWHTRTFRKGMTIEVVTKGKPEKLLLKTKTAAEKAAAAYAAALRAIRDNEDIPEQHRHHFTRAPRGGTSLRSIGAAYIQSKKNSGKATGTTKDYERWLKDYVYPWMEAHGAALIEQVQSYHVLAFKEALEADDKTLRSMKGKPENDPKWVGAPLSFGAKLQIFQRLKALLKYALQRGDITALPGRDIALEESNEEEQRRLDQNLVRMFQPWEVDLILKAADSFLEDPLPGRRKAWAERYHAMVYLAAYTGMRISEIQGMDPFSLTVRPGQIFVRLKIDKYARTRGTKRKASFRPVPLHPTAKAALDKVLDLKGLRTPEHRHTLIFGTKTGNGQAYGNLRKGLWLPLMKRCDEIAEAEGTEKIRDLEGRGFHAFRHFTVSVLLSLGYTLEQAGAIVGHSGSLTTLGYAHHIGVPHDLPIPGRKPED